MTKRLLYAAALLSLAFLATLTVKAQNVSGKMAVVDGDTLKLDNIYIRLAGIDAPELRQLCTLASAEWACGQKAAEALRTHIAGRVVHCVHVENDSYGRSISECHAGSDTDSLSHWMTANGWAVSYRRYSTKYLPQEVTAIETGRGLWQSDFLTPESWRRKQQLPRR